MSKKERLYCHFNGPMEAMPPFSSFTIKLEAERN
jgi:hypothetical protein